MIRKKLICCLLSIAMLCSLFTVSAYAKDADIYVNLGDSVAGGFVENSERYPEYDRHKNCYSCQVAEYLGAQRIDYSGPGMQSTDIMYMLDEQFRKDVDNGVLTPDSWHTNEYPPFNGVSLEEVRRNITDAKYVSICIGTCDYVSYPSEVLNDRLAQLPSVDEARETLKALRNGGKLDTATYRALSTLLQVNSQKAAAYLMLIADMLNGLADFAKYYPSIVEDILAVNPDVTIFIVGKYIPGSTVSFLEETADAPLVHYLNRLVDDYNVISKNVAAKYHCLYVDTVGVQSAWHPTPLGHTQIAQRMISVPEGDRTYAGHVQLVASLTNRLVSHITKQLRLPCISLC